MVKKQKQTNKKNRIKATTTTKKNVLATNRQDFRNEKKRRIYKGRKEEFYIYIYYCGLVHLFFFVRLLFGGKRKRLWGVCIDRRPSFK